MALILRSSACGPAATASTMHTWARSGPPAMRFRNAARPRRTFGAQKPPPPLGRPGAAGGIGPRHPDAQLLHDEVVGRQERLLLVGDVVVEGASRDAGQGDDVLDARCAVAVGTDGGHHASEDPLPLVG